MKKKNNDIAWRINSRQEAKTIQMWHLWQIFYHKHHEHWLNSYYSIFHILFRNVEQWKSVQVLNVKLATSIASLSTLLRSGNVIHWTPEKGCWSGYPYLHYQSQWLWCQADVSGDFMIRGQAQDLYIYCDTILR